MTVVYEQIKVSKKEAQQRLNDMFDILFTETFKFMKTDEYKAMKVKKIK